MNLIVTDVTAESVRATNITFSPDQFDDVIEIPICAVEKSAVLVALDVVEKGLCFPHAGACVERRKYTERAPTIILSVWRPSQKATQKSGAA